MSPRCEKHGKHAGICWDCADEAGKGPPWLADAAEALGEAGYAMKLGGEKKHVVTVDTSAVEVPPITGDR